MTRNSLALRVMQDGPNASNFSSLSHLSSSKRVICNHVCGGLPKGWQYSTLGKSCNILAGFGFPERLQGKTAGDFPFFKVGDISEAWKRGDVHLSKAHHYLSREEAAEIRARPLPKNTTVFAKIGAAIALNRRAILSEPALVDNNVMGLHPATEALDYKFLFHFICTVKLDELSRATTVPSVRKSDIEQIELPVPPLPEQRRIVAEIEKQFTRLEAGVSALKRVQVNLQRYRATVLKAACEGKLVPAEAEILNSAGKGQKGFESGEQLLKRILAERRKNWQGHGNYKEPVAPDTANLPPLPEGWTWATVEQLSTRVQYGSSAKTSEDSAGIPVLRMGNIQEGKFEFDKLKYLPKLHDEFPELLLAKDDLLFNRTNSAELVGKTAVFKGNPQPCSFASYLIRIRFGGGCLADFVSYFINSVFGRSWVAGCVSQQVGQANVNGTKLQALAIPLPPLAEQTRIVAEVERRLSMIEKLEAVVSANLQRAGRLRQAVLQKAFTGKLASDAKPRQSEKELL